MELSEEEKKAIEYLKKHAIPYVGTKGTIELFVNDTILNLIKKQQELIDLQSKKLLEFGHTLTFDYISKNKIMAKIEELEHNDFIAMQVVWKHDKEAQIKAQVLKELLEDN